MVASGTAMIRWACMSFGAVCALLFATAHAAEDDATSRYAPTPPVLYPGGVTSLRDVTYAELSGFRPLTLDLYLPPAGGAPKPAVVFVHGGAWRHRTARDGGTFRDFPSVLASVAARGYVVASVNYRLLGEASFPGPVQDVASSIRWLRAHAQEYGIDTTRFVLWGSSAGGQIAALIGTACDAQILEPAVSQGEQRAATKAGSACVQGVIDWYGIVDLASSAADFGKTGPASQRRESAYLGCELSKCAPEFVRSSSALSYIDARDPPFLIQHGVADTSVSTKQSQKLHEALRAAGVESELILYPGVDHGFAKVPDGGPDEAVNRKALEDVFGFLARRFPALPKPDGEHAVGMRRFELEDTERRGVVSEDANEPRVIPGYVWYPADKSVQGTRPYLTTAEVADQGQAMARNFEYGPKDLDHLGQIVAHSVEGLPPVQGQRFPILIFSHGYECYPAQNTAWIEQLVSHGYIVLSIGHPHDMADFRLADGTLLKTSHPVGRDSVFAGLQETLKGGPDHETRTAALGKYAEASRSDGLGASFDAWRDDTLFIARAIRERSVPAGLKSVLDAGDVQRLGLIGMSFGGATAASTCKLIPECRAAINLDGGNFDPTLFDASVQRPLLLLMSDWVGLPRPGRQSDPDFHPNDYAYEPWAQAGLNPDVVRLRVEGIRHMGFTDLILLLDGPEHAARFGTIAPSIASTAIADASLAFLDRYFKQGRREALDDVIRRTPVLHRHSPVSVREWAQARESVRGS